MPNINVELSEEEFQELSECKRKGMTWKQYLQSSMWIQAKLIRPAFNQWGKNWEFDEPVKFDKPCHSCGYCPFGSVVEMFPVTRKRTNYSCTVFGHNCPVFYMAEPMAEDILKVSEAKE